ncbi:4-hydroxybenzoate octaprenyltransferase [Novosphingobium sp. THN1]|uniref:4-hydroxybenzoate octaprenyltransferase n=1 Tax=unclassified Novosphingobium TaxID=2644732 RepID=UPI000E4DD475|nr:4-hydroxybenzoate octaprenyltransferase [Novosphingobium sp. THN1]AXU18002.1 4-hydroxybenzoate octaprenyltransferase [Novosphingobium sp. THN1]MBA4086219.1 4-hydroxybenzoate octaprenyltransferase [Novosphingobium sp.]NLR37762.1 4-hydroxybenzoate octaprenyltransferase [Novosphingobium sp. ERW19]
MTSTASETIVPDSEHKGLVASLPQPWRNLALLARFDRPIGWWLLFWPCAWGLFLGGGTARWGILAWMLLGAIAMRGAGCVYNDIVDADLDARVARTAARPIASGATSKRTAWIWLLTLCAVGLLVLLQLRWEAQVVALGSLALVAAYPFMKRITGWPQAWLGLVFTWGAPVGWVEATGFERLAPLAALYAGCWAWCMAYDTIYALQDREDDAMVGIGSSALSFGRHVRAGVGALYALALLCWAAAIWQVRADPLALLALAPVALHLLWQVATLKEDGADPLVKFRSNRFAGLLMAAAAYVVGAA